MIPIEKMQLGLKVQGLEKINPILNQEQQAYMELLTKGYTISHTVEHMLSKGRLVNFGSLFDLISKLYESKHISNPAFTEYFNKINQHTKNKSSESKLDFFSQIFKGEKQNKPEKYLNSHPFFRAQSPAITALFCQHAEVADVKPGTPLCQAHQLERDLFFLVEGEAAIYKPATENQPRRLLSFLSAGAVIGEVGFFMGELRTADVICTKPSKLVVVRYDETAFGCLINKDVARGLQTRFRVLHAIAKSPFLKNLPESSLDSLIYAGQTKSYKEGEMMTQQDQSGESCYVVISGSAVVKIGAKNVAVLGPGEMFGEIALFFTQGKRTATVIAQRDTLVLEIQAHSFYKMLSENILLAREFEKLALQRTQKNKNVAA